MEARTACRRSAIFKNIVAIIAAILAVFMVGATGGYLVKTLSLPVAAPSAPVVSAQSVMSDGSASNDRTGRSGTTNVEGPDGPRGDFSSRTNIQLVPDPLDVSLGSSLGDE